MCIRDSDSDCVLQPVFNCPDPLRGPNDRLVMCEVLLTDFTPHPSNTRVHLRELVDRYACLLYTSRCV